jgi:hypothetical protein
MVIKLQPGNRYSRRFLCPFREIGHENPIKIANLGTNIMKFYENIVSNYINLEYFKKIQPDF